MEYSCKEKVTELANWQDFYDWYQEVSSKDYQYNGQYVEGFVIEDALGFMFKLKTEYYLYWKKLRAVAQEAIKFGYIKKPSQLFDSLSNNFYSWVRQFHVGPAIECEAEEVSTVDENEDYSIDETLQETKTSDGIPRDIISLRRMFYESFQQ